MITFHNIRYKNILSTGNSWTEVDFEKSQSTLIIGENGAGKSTMLDAICFVLYGKPFRKINKPQLVNSLNGKGLEVEITFSSGDRKYLIKRGIKPAIFEIWLNGEMLNQDAAAKDYQQHLEENILKMSFKSFGQIVVLGSSTFVPFMQLPAAGRRSVIEDLLDLQIFSEMNSRLKEHQTDNKDSLVATKHKSELLSAEIEYARKNSENIHSMNDDRVKSIKDDIKKYVDDIESGKDKISKLEEEFPSNDSFIPLDEIRMDIATNERALKSNTDNVNFYQKHDQCPTCDQKLDEDFITKKIQKFDECKRDLDLILEQLKNEEMVSVNAADTINGIQSKINSIKLSNSVAMNTLKGLKKQLEESNKEVTSIDESKIKELMEKRLVCEEEHRRHTTHKEMLSVAGMLLRDSGIKSKIIKQYVPIITKSINKYLSDMGFFVNFELDENFSETIKSRGRDNFSYASFSEGEKLRIDLALMLTWREVSRMRSSTSTNLLILDEVFDGSMDDDGVDALTKILTTSKSNVFVISHKGEEIHSKFERILEAKKTKGFSSLETK